MKNKFLVALLSLLGFSCAESLDMYGSPRPEPSDCTLRGTVRSLSGTPLPAIRVHVANHPGETFSTEDGRYELSGDWYGTQRLVAEDVDGELNGLYEDSEIEVSISYADLVSEGRYQKEVNIYLKSKTSEQ